MSTEKRKCSQALILYLDHPQKMLQKLSVLGMDVIKSSVPTMVDGSLPRDFLPMKHHTLEGYIK